MANPADYSTGETFNLANDLKLCGKLRPLEHWGDRGKGLTPTWYDLKML